MFDIDKHSKKSGAEEGANPWTSFSDLFLVLTVVFLLLFVVANLKTGTATLSQTAELAATKQEVQDLKDKIQEYEAFYRKGATPEQVEASNAIVSRLELLKEKTDAEKQQALKTAMEADVRKDQLNEYQKMVKNVINFNLLAARQIKERENIIHSKDRNIRALQSMTDGYKNEVKSNVEQIAAIKARLRRQIASEKEKSVQERQKNVDLNRKVSTLQRESRMQIAKLESENTQQIQKLKNIHARFAKKNQQTEKLREQLLAKQSEFRTRIKELRAKQMQEMALQKSEQRRTLASSSEMKSKNQKYEKELDALNGQLEEAQDSLNKNEEKYKSESAFLSRTNKALEDALATANPTGFEHQQLIKTLQENLRLNGSSTAVDPTNGDLILTFRDSYFDISSAILKPSMKKTLEEIVPTYAKSLFQDKKVSDNIASVEIIGFASPTYKNKVYTTAEMHPGHKHAINYNMDLSYQRAKSIFAYIFDSARMSYPFQKELLRLVTVSGRSYLASDDSSIRKPTSEDLDDKHERHVCDYVDCAKTQKAIIKIHFKK